MLELMKFRTVIHQAVADSNCRFQSVSEAQSGAGWKRYRVDYQRLTGKRERVFIYLFEKSTDSTVKEDTLRAIRYQAELAEVLSTRVAESA